MKSPFLTGRRRLAALAVAGMLALCLTACIAPEAQGPTPAREAPSATTSPDVDATAGSRPEPGRTVEATPSTGAVDLRGVRIAVVVPDAGATSTTMRDAAQTFASQHGLIVEEFVAEGDSESVSSALTAALATEPHVVIGLGEGAADAFAYTSAQMLDHDFLLLGAQVPEPTANVTSVVWEGATSRGSGAPPDGELNYAAVTATRGEDAISAGLDAVMSGITGIVLRLPR